MCANSEGSGETAWMRRHARAFAGRLFGKYHNLMSWLISNVLSLTIIVCNSEGLYQYNNFKSTHLSLLKEALWLSAVCHCPIVERILFLMESLLKFL